MKRKTKEQRIKEWNDYIDLISGEGTSAIETQMIEMEKKRELYFKNLIRRIEDLENAMNKLCPFSWQREPLREGGRMGKIKIKKSKKKPKTCPE